MGRLDVPSMSSCRSCSFRIPLSTLALPSRVPPGSVEKSVVSEPPAALQTAARQTAIAPDFRRRTCPGSPLPWARFNGVRSSKVRRGKLNSETRSFVFISSHWVGCCTLKTGRMHRISPMTGREGLTENASATSADYEAREICQLTASHEFIPSAISPSSIAPNEVGSARLDNCAQGVGFETQASQLRNPCQAMRKRQCSDPAHHQTVPTRSKAEPQTEFQDWSFDTDDTLLKRITISQRRGAQGQRSGRTVAGDGLRVARERTVERVTQNRMAGFGKMNANLMRAARQRPGFDERFIVDGLQNAELCFRVLPPSRVHFHSPDFTRTGSEFEPANPASPLRHSPHNRQVNLMHLTILEQPAVGRRGARIFHKQQNSACVGVETVNETEELQAARTRPEIAALDAGDQRQMQVAAGPVPRLRREYPAGRFVDRDDRAVLVENRDDRAVRQFDWFGSGHSVMISKTEDETKGLATDVPLHHDPRSKPRDEGGSSQPEAARGDPRSRSRNHRSPVTTPAKFLFKTKTIEAARSIRRRFDDCQYAAVAGNRLQAIPRPIAQRILVFDRVNEVADAAESERYLCPVEAHTRDGRWRDHSQDGDVAHDGPGCVADDDPIIAGDRGLHVGQHQRIVGRAGDVAGQPTRAPLIEQRRGAGRSHGEGKVCARVDGLRHRLSGNDRRSARLHCPDARARDHRILLEHGVVLVKARVVPANHFDEVRTVRQSGE